MRLPSQPFNPPPGGSQTQGQRQRRGLLPARWAVESTAIVIVVGVVLASTIVPGCDEAAAAWTALGSATAAEAAVTAAAWYWAWACSKKSSMPAMSTLALLLIQLASGACNLKKIWLQHSCSLPSSFLDPVLQSGLPVMSTALSYTITLATGAWRPGQARWRRRRQLLQGVVHAATFATITIRFRATWPAFALSAFAGLTLGRTASALAWLGVQRIVPKTICDLVNKHADEGMFADVHDGLDAVKHTDMMLAISFIYIVMAFANAIELFGVELPTWLLAMIQGQGVEPAAGAATPPAD